MRISFRQGLVRAPANFLQLSGGRVSIALASDESIAVAFADRASNYLVTERQPITNAWIGPFSGGTAYWLFWDLNASTGARTFGHTLLEPEEGATAPTNPQNDQHWFDTSINQMKVWNSLATRWMPVIRVFAAQLSTAGTFVSMSINSPAFTGTQIGNLQTQAVNVGALVFDADGAPVKRSNGTFFTTEDVAVTGIASSSQVKLGSMVVEAKAEANIPAFSVVRFTAFNTINVATNYLVDNGMYGIVDVAVSAGSLAQVTTDGLITNPAWDWTSVGINTPLYVDSQGQLTTTAPPTPIPVAAVADKHSILLRPASLFLDTTNDPASATSFGAVKLSVAPDTVGNSIAVGINDPLVTGITNHVGNNALHLTSTEKAAATALAGAINGNFNNWVASLGGGGGVDLSEIEDDISALQAQVTVTQAANPSAAPEFDGQRWVNTATGQIFIARGHAAVGDWVELAALNSTTNKLPPSYIGMDLVLTTSLQPIHYPTLNLKATLTAGSGTTVVDVLDQNSNTVGTFSLDTIGASISSGFITNLAGQLRYNVVSGTGTFNIRATITA